MYIRKASRTYKGKTYFNYLLVESVLTPQGPRQKIICSLGDLSPRPRAEWLSLAHKMESALSGQPELPAAAGSDAEVNRLVAKVRAAHPLTTALSSPADAARGSESVAVHVDRVRTEECREADVSKAANARIIAKLRTKKGLVELS